MKRHIIIAMLFGARCLFADTTATNSAIQPNPVFDQKLQKMLQFLNEQKVSNSDMSEGEFDAHVAAFVTNSVLREGEFLIQMALAYGKQESPEDNLMVRVIWGKALKRLTASDIVESIAPYYALAMPPELRRNLEHILDTASVQNGRLRPDYRAFIFYLERNKEAPPQRLVRYMFQVNLDKALAEVHKVYGKSGTEAKSLQAAARGEWWEELYAAEKMRQNSNFRDVELIEQLKQSKHAVVRETVQEIGDVKYKDHATFKDK